MKQSKFVTKLFKFKKSKKHLKNYQSKSTKLLLMSVYGNKKLELLSDLLSPKAFFSFLDIISKLIIDKTRNKATDVLFLFSTF